MRIFEKDYYDKARAGKSLFAYFLNRKEPDRTELNRACKEVLEAMRLEHDKDRKIIKEALAGDDSFYREGKNKNNFVTQGNGARGGTVL